MKVITILSLLSVFLCYYGTFTLSLPGPQVYVVTPASRVQIDEGRSAPQPFYYHNWMRRMDPPPNATTTSTTIKPTPKVETPDLIFAEFESDKMKNIRKLLEKERIQPKTTTTTTTTTFKPIRVTETEVQIPQKEIADTNQKDMTDYFALYNNLYNKDNAPPVRIFLPSTTTPRTTTTTTTPAPVQKVENIWHIIDSQKQDQYSDQWDEIPLESENDQNNVQDNKQNDNDKTNEEKGVEDEEKIDEHFALPGFHTNPGIGGENESRAIRTEPNMRFPYVNLKPFQMKNMKKPLINAFPNNKEGNNMYTNLDNFMEVKHPVRGEAQDVVHKRQPIDRYNPAQPYLPGDYGSKSKQSSPSSAPTKTVANLIPPPPPPPPKITDDDFPAPTTYDAFPPFAPSAPDTAPAPPVSAFKPPLSVPSYDFDSGDDSGPVLDLSYRYKPPSPPSDFLPTAPPLQKPYGGGYSYNKPPMTPEAAPPNTNYEPNFQGYHYDKPAPIPDKPDYGYHYKKPESSPPLKDHGPGYGHDYPVIFDTHHGSLDDSKGSDDPNMKPPPMPDTKPDDDSGFPHDFPGDFKYHFHDDHDDHDDHEVYHYHDHHPTTTSTTEMPRVNRYSYYYLGKKLYYLPLYFSVYFIVYVGALIIKAVLRHKIVYPNSWRPNDQTAGFFSKRSVDSWDFSNKNLHEITGRVTHAIGKAAERYVGSKKIIKEN